MGRCIALMKIAISGTHSTGKTTFLEAVRTAVAPMVLPKIAGLAPEARDHGFPILKQHTFESTLWLMTAGIKYELEARLKHPVVLVDRPVMEAYAYLNAALKNRGETLIPAQDECLDGIARGYAFTYDLMIKTVVDESLPIATNKKRDHDAEFRRLVDQEIELLYARLHIPLRRLEFGDKGILPDTVAMVRTGLDAAPAKIAPA